MNRRPLLSALLTLIAAVCAAPAAAAPDPEAAAVVKVLSDADVARYREIFALQEKGDWGAADARIMKLENDVLMGYVLEQRYMHPTAYRSSYAELSDWLQDYADIPGADRIFKLASRRGPASALRAPEVRRWRSPKGAGLHPELAADYESGSYSRRRAVARIEAEVRSLLGRERATQSLNYIDDPRQRNLLTEAQYDRIRSWIAAAYYHLDYIPKAQRLATQVAARNGDKAVMAYWIAGLSAWREDDPDAAYLHFSKMAAVPYQDEWMRAGAAFWAARSALAARRPADVAPMLEVAAAEPFTFYGQLALAQLGRSYDYNWAPPKLTADRFADLAEREPRVARAAALAQLGRADEAHEELRRAHGALTAEDDETLLAVACAVDIPQSQMFIALQAGGGRAFEAGLYPLPSYAPASGFAVDRALLFAMARQESKFEAGATSRAGARGLLQLMPATARYVARLASLDAPLLSRLDEPEVNLEFGQAYMRHLMETGLSDDMLQFAVAYNGGPGNLRRWKAARPTEDPLLFIESIPSPETREYVERVLTNLWIYRDRLGQTTPSRDAAAAGRGAMYEALDTGQ